MHTVQSVLILSNSPSNMTDRTLPISAPRSKKQGGFRSWRRSLETEYNTELCAALEPIIHLHIVSLVTHGEMFDMLYLGRWIIGKVCQGHHIFRDESQWVAFSPATGSRERRTEDGRIKEETCGCESKRRQTSADHVAFFIQCGVIMLIKKKGIVEIEVTKSSAFVSGLYREWVECREWECVNLRLKMI